ncbi:MAG: response regulator [Flavobacteriales bacterium]|nr:response regulator [Flavobacteriales bacterium]
MHDRRSWWNSIVTRATLVFTVFVVASTSIAGYLVYRAGREQIDVMASEDLRRTSDLVVLRIGTFVNTLDDDIGFLADNDPVSAFARAWTDRDTAGVRSAIDRVALLMGSFIRSRPLYAQVRLIAADSLGHELVRFDQQNDHIRRVPAQELQDKGDRDYYQEAVALAPGRRYFSRIDLNREHGRVWKPVMPTLRAATAVRGPNGRLVGVVVINTDLHPFFAELEVLVSTRQQLVMARDDGQLVLHPDTALTFRDDYGGSFTLEDLLGRTSLQTAGDLEMGDRFWSLRSIRPSPWMRSLSIAVSMDTRPLVADLRSRRNRALLITVAIAGCFVLLSLLFARSIARRLQAITERIERYSEGDPMAGDLLHRKDEIGSLARSFQRMQGQIDHRVRELEEARARAERADIQRRDLLANMSHEVRTPLNAILGMADAIRTDGLDPADLERLATIQRSGYRLKRLVDDLLLNARMAEGRLKMDPRPTDVRQVLTDVAQAHRPLAEHKGLALRIRFHDLMDRFMIDPLRLHQIADNLVGNAVKYTIRGHVDIEAHTALDGLHIAVSDTGPGVAPEERARIFERFEKASHGDGDDPSAGLGLAITKRLVHMLRGSIRLESTVGIGSRFIVHLPEQRSEGEGIRRDPLGEDVLHGLRVLYVEDVATNRMLMEHWAAKGGWELQMATNAGEAIDMTRQGSFDILLIDLDLGDGATGSELALRVRGLRRYRPVPILAVTAYVDEDPIDAAMRAGMNDRITKPIDVDELFERLAFWSGRSEAYCHEVVDLDPLSAQFDDDRDLMTKALDRYRKEFVSIRSALRVALEQGDAVALARERHKLLPHWRLLRLASGVKALEGLRVDAEDGDQDLLNVMDTFRCCERTFLSYHRRILLREGPDA